MKAIWADAEDATFKVSGHSLTRRRGFGVSFWESCKAALDKTRTVIHFHALTVDTKIREESKS